MPVFELSLAAMGAVATASYWVPLVVTCGAAVMTSIGSFFWGMKLGRRKHHTDLSLLKKQQYERDKQTKIEAEQMVTQTAENVRDILEQSKRQQIQWDETVSSFQQHVDSSHQATDMLQQVTVAIQHHAVTEQQQLLAMCVELERLNKALVCVTLALRQSEQALQEKNEHMAQTLEQLSLTEKKATFDTEKSMQYIQDLHSQLAHLQAEWSLHHQRQQEKRQDIEHLHQYNQQCLATIKKLESVIVHLNAALQNSMMEKQSAHQEIQRLIEENHECMQLIESLTQLIESAGLSYPIVTTAKRESVDALSRHDSHPLRLFG